MKDGLCRRELFRDEAVNGLSKALENSVGDRLSSDFNAFALFAFAPDHRHLSFGFCIGLSSGPDHKMQMARVNRIHLPFRHPARRIAPFSLQTLRETPRRNDSIHLAPDIAHNRISSGHKRA